MKIGIFSPYLPILGGGERYILSIALCFTQKHEVDIFWDDTGILKKAKEKFGLNLNKIKVKPIPRGKLTKFAILKKYEIIFYMTDGSLFFSPAKKNILIIQSPAHIPPLTSFISRLKLKNWQTIICYSKFMAKIIEERLKREARVLFVPVDLGYFKPTQKENIILSVGRFFPHLHSKKQDVLVEIFKKIKNRLPGWKLYLVGSVDKGGEDYLNRINKMAEGEPIEILTNVSFTQLVNLYGRAKLFCHAAGFDEDLKVHPERAEHFGVVTIEAMAAGVVPVVFAGGGQPEIVDHGKTGFLWQTKEELVRFTLKLAEDDNLRESLSKEAQKRVRDFSSEKFCHYLYEIIK